MNIIVNGQPRTVKDGCTVRGLIEELELTGGPVAVERNREVVPRSEHAQEQLANGDVLEIVHFVGGG